MVEFRLTMGGFEVVVDGKRLGYIQEPHKYGFFTGPTCVLDHIKVSPKDLREIADKTEEVLGGGVCTKL